MPEDKKETQYDVDMEFTFEVPIIQTAIHKQLTNLSASSTTNNPEVRKTIVMVGDRFMNGKFFSGEELERSGPLWEGTLHDINHMGTTFRTGFSAQSNILFFVGWQDNVQFDNESKALSMDIHPKSNTHYGKDWNAFIELCDDAGLTPNVSISFLGKVRRVKASSLPESSNYSAYGYTADDMVDYIYDVRPRALSTVLKGLCDDAHGCGIATNNSESVSKEIENTEDQENAEKRIYLEKRLRKFGGK